MQKGIMLKKCQKNQAYVICFSFVSFIHQFCRLSSAVSHLSFFHIFLLFFLFILHVLPLFRVFQGKTHPAPSARPFGAMRRLELWY